MPAPKKATKGSPAKKTTKARPTPPAPAAKRPAYTVVRDTREKDGHGWWFAPSQSCAGTVEAALKTGDYTLQGYEDVFTLDRKGSVSEFAGNLNEARFERELERMAGFRLAIVLLEFDLDDIMRWPETSGIPKSRWKMLRTTARSLLARLMKLQLKYPYVSFLFAGIHGKEVASSLFKRVVEDNPIPAREP